jgi:hypothetical protein
MPRTRKTTRYDADAVTIRRFFEQSWNVRAEQKAASQLISATNVEMEAAGVSSGVMSVMRLIRAMPEGKRGFHLFLLRRYADVLEKELHDPTFAAETEAKPAEAGSPVPFERRTAA